MPESAKSKSKAGLSSHDYEKIGRQLESMYTGFNWSRRKIYGINLLLGVIRGFGAVLGATIGIAILLWILSFFTNIPLVGPVFQNIKQTVNSQNQ